ncbi:MAG TPA: hypothetical protein PKM44_04330 [Turneriella sp.]|nr:hypothetical protein [Turneriella sp.]HNA79259.1 hypothetical protein [Turneriella sp.]HNL09713.1 hypothetical protein [Turneriella sp.]HNL54771.1 hypothetical protein [Turneriella sp.]
MLARIFGILLLALALSQCNNYDLLDRLESPGSSTNERFATNYYVFVSSWTTAGDMSNSPYPECSTSTGPARADCACTRAAIQRGFRRSASHVFRAWLSVSGVSDAKCRVQAQGNGCATNFPAPWLNTQGQQVVANFNDFGLGGLANPIKFDEFGVDQGPNLVWTNTGSSGTALTADCSGWTSNSAGFFGAIGNRTSGGPIWTAEVPDQACNTAQRMYCFASPAF